MWTHGKQKIIRAVLFQNKYWMYINERNTLKDYIALKIWSLLCKETYPLFSP